MSVSRFAGSPQIGSFLHSKLDFGDTAQAGQKANAEQRITATKADALVGKADIEANAMLEMAKMGADATRAQGQAAQQAGIFGGITSGLTGLAGAFGGGGSFSYAGGPGSSGTAMGAGGGSVGGYGTLGPNYGFKV